MHTHGIPCDVLMHVYIVQGGENLSSLNIYYSRPFWEFVLETISTLSLSIVTFLQNKTSEHFFCLSVTCYPLSILSSSFPLLSPVPGVHCFPSNSSTMFLDSTCNHAVVMTCSSVHLTRNDRVASFFFF